MDRVRHKHRQLLSLPSVLSSLSFFSISLRGHIYIGKLALVPYSQSCEKLKGSNLKDSDRLGLQYMDSMVIVLEERKT